MNDQTELRLFIELITGLAGIFAAVWAIFCFFAVPIWIHSIAKDVKRIANRKP